MHPLTEADVRASFVNAAEDELRLIELPHDFLLTDWDYLDFFAWRDPSSSKRGYVLLEHEGRTVGIVLQTAGAGRTRSGMCNVCHTMQPGNQVALWAARRAGDRGRRGDTVGTYVCADLSCHENVRLAHPLAPNEVLAPGQVDMRLDGTRRRMHDLVLRVLED
ncbi:FBP domain-containing protein [Microbacterium sp. NPDC057659]|uniref:FBP domain-containing protein n=1 Tax=Microbacterium sp. NPDC057659 TaxID=3346198 RepID=UPI00366B2254